MSKIYGLTGGIGMGKSTAARLLAQEGLSVVDSDDLARDAVRPGQRALEEIRTAFGGRFIQTDGHLDRAEMATHVFADPEARERLEAIIHPCVREAWRTAIGEWREAGQSGVVVIPLLFEVGAEEHFDTILCVACTEPTQRDRLRRRGWTDEQIDQRLAAQMPIAEKMQSAHCILWNEGTTEVLRAQLLRAGCLKEKPA